jgi:DNA modification methylase
MNDNVYFYYKKRNEFLPVKDKAKNKKAKKILEEIYGTKKDKIPKRLLSQWNEIALYNSAGNIEKANSLYVKSENSAYDMGNKLNDLTSKAWIQETISVFSQKGLGAKNENAQIEKEHPAPFSYQDVGRLITFFTKEGEKVLDPFCGVASTLKACALESRIGVGIELNNKYCKLGKKRIDKEIPSSCKYKSKQRIVLGNCENAIKKFKDNEFSFIITSPPYWNILETVDHKVKQQRIKNNLDIKYSDDKNDFGNIKRYDTFINKLCGFFDDCSRILLPQKYLCIIVSDFRKKDSFYLLHADIAHKLEEMGNFKLKGVRILYQRHKSIFPYGYPFSFVSNVHHQNVLILQKIK